MRRLRTSLRDVAREAGVSHVTVSMALRGSTRISEAQRLRISQLADSMGYKKDPMLTALAHYRTEKRHRSIVGELALLNDWSSPEELRRYQEFSSYLCAAAQEAERLGYRLQEYKLQSENISTSRLQSILFARNTLGVLIPPHHEPFRHVSLDWSRLCIVKFGHSVPRPRGQIVTCDQFRAGTLAMESLLALGYERIGYLSSDLFESTTSRRFLGGYLAVSSTLDKSRQLTPLIIKKTEFAKDRGKQLFLTWLKSARPQVVISGAGPEFTDERIRGCADIPHICALNVPFGNATYYVDQHPEEIGTVAVRQLCAAIELRDIGEPEIENRILVDPSLNTVQPYGAVTASTGS